MLEAAQVGGGLLATGQGFLPGGDRADSEHQRYPEKLRIRIAAIEFRKLHGHFLNDFRSGRSRKPTNLIDEPKINSSQGGYPLRFFISPYTLYFFRYFTNKVGLYRVARRHLDGDRFRRVKRLHVGRINLPCILRRGSSLNNRDRRGQASYPPLMMLFDFHL